MPIRSSSTFRNDYRRCVVEYFGNDYLVVLRNGYGRSKLEQFTYQFLFKNIFINLNIIFLECDLKQTMKELHILSFMYKTNTIEMIFLI